MNQEDRITIAGHEKVLMIGAGTAAQMIAQLINEASPYGNYQVTAFLADDIPTDLEVIPGIKNIGGTNRIEELKDRFNYIYIGINSHKYRKEARDFFDRSKALGYKFINVIHPSAAVHTKDIGENNYVGAFSYLAPFSSLGSGNYLSSYSCIEHHAKVGSFNSWGPSNHLSGSCVIGDAVCMGTGVKIVDHISVGDRSFIASHIMVSQNIPANSRVLYKGDPGIKVVTREIK